MPTGDAVQDRPTVDQQISKFKSFAVNDAEMTTEQRENAALEHNAPKPAVEDEVRPLKEGKKAEPAAEEPAVEAAAEGEKPGEKKETEAAAEKVTPGVQKRIDQATKKQRQAERERDAERQRTSSLEARLAALEGRGLTEKKQDTTVDPNKAPVPEDFTYGELDAQYIRALARHEARLEYQEGQKLQQEKQQREAVDRDAVEVAEQAKAFESAGAEEFDDFHEVVIEGARNREWDLSPTLGRLILSSEVGPKIAYQLANDPKEARRVFGLTAVQQAAYFGRQEAKFSSATGADPETTAKPKAPVQTSKAPAPVTGARGANGSTTGAASPKDFKTFEAQAMGRR